MEWLESFLGTANGNLSYLIVGLLLLAGLYFSIRGKLVQVRLIGESIRCIKEKSHIEKTSSFQAMMISTASRVGTGNITGIALGVIIGGPGTIFWMWVIAILGASLAFAESTLAQVYKTRSGDEFIGGPAYYIEKALGKRWLGIVFAILLITCFSYGFNVMQANSMSETMLYYINNYRSTNCPIFLGIGVAIITALLIFGGIHKIGFITSYIVPFKALLYIGLGFFIIFKNWNLIPQMFTLIFKCAFDPRAIFSGLSTSAIIVGAKKGLLSNEAGMGSAPNAAASADVSHPAKQGVVQVLSVYIDTFLICTTTAFMVLLSLISRGDLNNKDIPVGISYIQLVFKEQFGETGVFLITFAIFAFALSAIAGNYCYAESNILFIKKDNKLFLNIFRVTCIIAVFLGVLSKLETAWNLAEIFMSMLATVNIIAITLLSGVVFKTLNDYIKQINEGKDPIFNPAALKIKNTETWG